MIKLNLLEAAAAYLRENLGLSPAEEEVALYGLKITVYSTANLISVVLTGLLLDCLGPALAATLAAGTLRLFSGGAHSRSPLTCNILGMLVAGCAGKFSSLLAPKFSPSGLFVLVLLGAALAFLPFLRLAPVDSPNKPLAPVERKKMRRLSLLFFFLIVFFQLGTLALKGPSSLVLAVSLGVWWQAFSLTRAGHGLATFIDNLFSLKQREVLRG
ncbi:MAG: accessory gene regulator B family protein [Thermanaeromonas sp.]|uniref:accessory gene regulator ArgB-like protein n=1 Tax=Thermanaeromonas sp. TaxID=2003697 RepID=UPI002440524E|nr:accessory gene regulator B family protein [Thermanaeromonas sp.]MCG0278327.1 accessory gene regulator B family protein [Thermanaeromonas sp.]